MSFAHPIFTSAVAGGTKLAARAAQLIYREVGAAAVSMAAEAAVGLIAETAEQAAAFTIEQIENLSTAAIASLLGVHCPGMEDGPVVEDNDTVNRLLNTIADREGGPAELAEAIETRASEFEFEAETALAVANISLPGGCALGILRSDNDLLSAKRFPEDSGAPRRLRNCIPKSTDGYRVSREPHEWEYCRKSQWGDVLAEVRQWGERVVEAFDDDEIDNIPFEADDVLTISSIRMAVEEDSISFATIDYTFGNFVDAVYMRKGIEQFRRTNRALTGDRFTDLLTLLQQDREQIISNINNNTNWQRQFRELLLLGVQDQSGQHGAVNPNPDN